MRIKMLAITVAIASAKLLAAPIPGYVSDGLIAQWDGIDNAATGAHDASATAWTDLVGGRQFVFTGAVDIGKDNIVFPGATTAYGKLNEADSTATFKKAGVDGGTIEVFFKADDASAKAAVFQAPGGITVAHFVENGADQTILSSGSLCPSLDWGWSAETFNGVSVTYTNSRPESANGYLVNGVEVGTTTARNLTASGAETILGGRQAKNNYMYKGAVYAIRVYDRYLTEAERLQNYEADVRRFVSHAAPDVLEISGSPRNAGTPKPGYGCLSGIAAGRTIDCSAPETVVNAEGVTEWTLNGWDLLDAAGTVVASGTGSEFVYTHPTPAAVRKLVWKWSEHGTELPATATQADIQAALDSAGPGSTVILPEGTYDIASTLWVTNAVTLKGAGADKTILRGSATLADYESLIYLNNKDAVVSQLTVRDVTRSKYWGFNAIGVQIRSGRFEWGRVTGCTSAAFNLCGAVSLHGADAALSHSRIDHNTLTSTGNGGGGVMLEGGGVADNCLVDHNTALTYGGVYFRGAGKMVNCTVVGNTATTGTFGGIGTHASGVLVNTIARYNIASSATADISAGGTIRHCASSEGVGTDPVSADPEFTDAANEDYTLLVSSPCFNKGSQEEAEAIVGVVEKDLAGGTRVMGAEIDIGCYEYDTSKAACAFAADTSETLIGNAVTLTASCSGFDGADDLVYTWLLTSASAAEPIERTGSPLEFNAEKPERYSVTLTVSSAMLGKEISATKENYFYVAPLTNYVTSAKVDTAVFPYATPETAATNVLDAVAAAIARSTVKLDAGRHDVPGEIQLIRAVTLVGAGRDETELYATSAFGNILKINDAGALVSDLTVSHARGVAIVYTGVAVNILANGGTLRRVRVTDCSDGGTSYITGVINMQSSAGRITHCQIDNCDIGKSGGSNHGGGAVYMTAGLIDNTIIADCYSTYYRYLDIDNGGGLTLAGGKAVNCTIVRNTLASSVGGGVCKRPGAVLENCIVYDNKAPGDTTDPEETGAPNLGGSLENINHCLVGQAVGTDPVAGEPAFMDAPNGDFRLASSSPCRDVAEVDRYLELLGLDTIEDETDFGEMPRLSGAKIDVGAHEYDASKVSCAFSVDKTVAFVPATFTLTPSVEGFADPEGATLTWTFEPVHGGEPIVVVQTGTNALCQVLSSNEQYKVSLAGAGAGQSGSFTRADPIYAAARTNYVTATANPNCCFPYGTPETAATNLADAVDASVDDATVLVGEGTNVVRATILLEKKITVKGVARDRTWLRAPTAYGPLIRFNHADAIVSDLTIANGQAIDNWKSSGSAAAVDFDTKGGTLAGCRITECGLDRKNVSANMGSEVAALFLHSDNAVATRCVVDNFDGIGYRAGSTSHCGGCGVIATAGRIDNSIISNVVGVAKGDFLGLALNVRGTAVALNCTVVSNSEYLAGGGVGVHALSTVQNTVSVDNFNSAGVESNVGGEEKCVCCLSPSFTSTANGNVIGRPVYREGSLVQKADSPGRNKGSVVGYEDILFGGTDFYGNRRVKSPRRSAKAKIDIGCAESDPDGLTIFVK